MEINGIPSLSLSLWTLIMLAFFATSNTTETDIRCLKSIKESLEDPFGTLANWNFSDISEGFICRFVGVICRHDNMNQVYNLRLKGMSLRGQFPIGITYCTSIEFINLSKNGLSGPIPSNIGNVLPYLVYLDLSDNYFSGTIPPSIANASFINVLRLDNNCLIGQIPPELSGLYRINAFSVANNRLSGPVPVFRTNFSTESYENNTGLCGGPLNACEDDKHDDIDDVFLSGFAVGCTIFTILSMVFVFVYFP